MSFAQFNAFYIIYNVTIGFLHDGIINFFNSSVYLTVDLFI